MLNSFGQFIGLVAVAVCAPLLFFGITKAEKDTQTPWATVSPSSGPQITQIQMTKESELRAAIENLKRKNPDYSKMEPKTRFMLREQKTAAARFLQNLGPIEEMIFIENDSGVDVYIVQFHRARTIWEFGKSARGRINVLGYNVLPNTGMNNLPSAII